MLLDALVRASTEIAGRSGRLFKIERLATLLGALSHDETSIGVAYLTGELPQGSIGVGWAMLRDLAVDPATAPSLEIREVDALFQRLAGIAGKGSQAARRALLVDLFGRATESERGFLHRVLSGELRQGAVEGLMIEAIARAASVASEEIRRALMVSGDLGAVARTALGDGAGRLAQFRLTLLRPLRPMLAETAEGVSDALSKIDPAALEWKLDGARIQVHRAGDDIRVFTRTLADITDRVPEIVEAVRALAVRSIILDGEAIALSPDGDPHAFQTTMSRFGTRIDVAQMRASLPLSPFFFDCLHLDGVDLLDHPSSDRVLAMRGALPAALCVPRVITGDAAVAASFLADALAHHHEGIMVKSPSAPYEAGRRGSSWLKVKVAHTLDLVVLAAEWGHGRRQGRLSNLHLGARDPETGSFVMVGKTFKGMTDEVLAWQTEKLLALETRREGITVHVRPELVVEVAFDGVQASTRYPGGVALRFARIKGYRPDKRADEGDTITRVRAVLPTLATHSA